MINAAGEGHQKPQWCPVLCNIMRWSGLFGLVYLRLDWQASKGVSKGLLDLSAHGCLQGAVLAQERDQLAVDALPVVVEDEIAQA